jgi:preprotein translocase subunit YajC
MNFAAEQSGSGALNLLLLLAIPLVFYFLLIRPQSRRRKEQLRMQSSLVPGARVMTTSGMYATVVDVDDDGVVLEIADGVEARFVKQAVMQVISEDDEADELDDESEESGEAEGGKPAGEGIDLSKAEAAEYADKGAKAEEVTEGEGASKARAAGKSAT